MTKKQRREIVMDALRILMTAQTSPTRLDQLSPETITGFKEYLNVADLDHIFPTFQEFWTGWKSRAEEAKLMDLFKEIEPKDQMAMYEQEKARFIALQLLAGMIGGLDDT